MTRPAFGQLELWQRPGLWYAALASMLLAAYGLSSAPGYTFEDTSLFAAACYTLGVAHPPGYPLQVLTCAPFAHLAEWAGWHPAKGAAFASSLAATGACVLLAHLARRVSGSAPAGVLAAAACALTPVFWSQAVIPEAYALNCLLLVAALVAAHEYCRRLREIWLYAFSLCLGLGLANHWPLFVLASPALALWFAPGYARLAAALANLRVLGLCVLMLAIGLAPYLLLLRPGPDSAVFLGASLPEDFVDYVTREQYREFDRAAQHPRWDERLRNAGLALAAALLQYTWAGAVIGMCGFARPGRLQASRLLAIGWGVLSCTFVLALLRPYLAESEQSTAIFSVYSLGAVALFAVPLALALAWLARALGLARPAQWLAAAACIAVMVKLNAAQAYRGLDDLAMRYAAVVSAELSEDSLLLVGASNDDFPLVYDKYFGRRQWPRHQAANFQNYLDRRGAQPTYEQLPQYLAGETRPVYLSLSVPLRDELAAYRGAYRSWAPRPLARLSEPVRGLLRQAAELRDKGNSAATRQFADQLILQFMLRADPHADSANVQDLALARELSESHAGRYAAFLRATFDPNNVPKLGHVLAQLAKLGPLEQYPLLWRVEIMHALAAAQLAAGQSEAALATWQEALRMYSAAQNAKVLTALLALHAQHGDFASYAYLRRRYPALAAPELAGYDEQCRSNLRRKCT